MLMFMFMMASMTVAGYRRDLVYEHKIELQLDSIDPSLSPVFRAATAALDAENLALADSLYGIVFRKAPTFDPVVRRLGAILVRRGKTQEGIELGKHALAMNRSVPNLVSLANCYLFLGNSGDTGNAYVTEATALLLEAEKMPGGDDKDVQYLLGSIAIRNQDITALRSATLKLIKNHPEVMEAHYFTAIVAVFDENWVEARREILIARNMGLEEGVVQAFLNSGVQRHFVIRETLYIFLGVVVLWITGLLLLFLSGVLLSGLTLRSLELSQRSGFARRTGSVIKHVYRVLINFSGFYYYISLPVILILIIALAAGLVYLFLMIGTLPVYLIFLLVAGAGMSIYGMIRSLLVKVKYADQGRALRQEEAPGLFDLTREVADAMGTRPIDEIRITPFTDCAVYERGTWREKHNDRAKRILVIGAGTLKDFNPQDFCAVLAHEYGHFSHRDTAGGAVALRVQQDIYNYYYALRAAGQNVWWNVAFQFLRLYNFIFLRISHGASRLQEALADRAAAQAYGAQSFQQGLTYLIKRRIEFVQCANAEINRAKDIQKPVGNLYMLKADSGAGAEQELQDELNRKTSPYDTHPGPVERFHFLEGIHGVIVCNETLPLDQLFTDWDALTAEMTRAITDKLG